jgi:uncharacterized SAM-binding protein YcdF (DUF218 family)
MYGLTRATTTLIAAAAAGLLIWFATQIDDKNVGGFWAVYGLIAGAGLLMALSQLLGGWTKWGWPRLSATFLLTAFVPIAIVSLWIILAAEPGNGWFHNHVLSWSSDLHIQGLVNDLKEYVPVFAFGIGLLFGFSFDTTGPRRDVVAPARTTGRRGLFGRRRSTDADGDGVPDADEPVTRGRAAEDGEVPVEDRDRVTTG